MTYGHSRLNKVIQVYYFDPDLNLVGKKNICFLAQSKQQTCEYWVFNNIDRSEVLD